MSWRFLLLGILILITACRRPLPAAPSVAAGPTSIPVPAATPAPQPLVYTVAEGDSLWSIAQRFGVTVEALQEANKLHNDEILQVGQELVIPDDASTFAIPSPTPFSSKGQVYIVAEGDSLWSIALKFEITVGSLAAANRLSDLDALAVGQRLAIPKAD